MEINPVFDSAALAAGLGFQTEMTQVENSPIRQLALDRSEAERLFRLQPEKTAAFLHNQAAAIVGDLMGAGNSLQFQLPASIAVPTSPKSAFEILPLPAEYLRQTLGAGLLRPSPARLRTRFRMRLADLEQSRCAGVSAAARLIRYAVVSRLVYDLPPAGNQDRRMPAGTTRVIKPRKDADGSNDRAIFPPDWAIGGRKESLSAQSIRAAEKSITAMQAYLGQLHLAVSLAPYIFADSEYQYRRNQTLIRLVHKAQNLAAGQTGVIIRRVRRMAADEELNLGLSLSIPYFDDQTLEMKLYHFVAIPGRIQFVPAFVALAARREQSLVEHDMRRSQSTRMHLLSLLKDWERAFLPAPESLR